MKLTTVLILHKIFGYRNWLTHLLNFICLRLLSHNIFGIVDDGGIGTPIQTNMLYDQTTASFGSSEVISMLYKFLRFERNRSFASALYTFPCW